MIVTVMPSVLKVVLVDINPQVVQAWRAVFADVPEVEVVHGSILEQRVDAWVTPTNARARMNGGVDAAIKHHLGAEIEKRVRREVARRFGRQLPVGCATCVPTGVSVPRFVISAPTMRRSAEDVSATLNTALACAAAFQAAHMHNAVEPDGITSVALPGLGAATGCVPPHVCANLMWTGYTLFREGAFRDFDALRAAFVEQLGHRGAVLERERVRLRVPESASEFVRVAPVTAGDASPARRW